MLRLSHPQLGEVFSGGGRFRPTKSRTKQDCNNPKAGDKIIRLIRDAADHAHKETSSELEPELNRKVEWPILYTVGLGLGGAIADHLAREKPEIARPYQTARTLEKEIRTTLGKEKRSFPDVDFYSGLVYGAWGMEPKHAYVE